MRPVSAVCFIVVRRRALLDPITGMTKAAIGHNFHVSTRYVDELPPPRRGRMGCRPLLAEHSDWLIQIVQEHPGATLEEIRERFGIAVGLTTTWMALKRLGVTFMEGGSRRRATRA